MIAAMLPLSLVAQDDDLYFVPTKKSVEKVTDNYGIPTDVYYSGSNRSIDEYNRRTKSHYEVIGADSTLNDTISFTAEKGVYPDSISDEDFELTKAGMTLGTMAVGAGTMPGMIPGMLTGMIHGTMVGMIPGITATAGMVLGITAGILAVASDVLM